MNGPELLAELRPQRDAMLATLSAWVAHESPSRDKGALDALARIVAERFDAIGGDVERIGNPDGGDHVRARFGLKAGGGVPPALVLGHFDTVWPSGTVAGRPFRVEGDHAYGPGVFDMKASLVLVEWLDPP